MQAALNILKKSAKRFTYLKLSKFMLGAFLVTFPFQIRKLVFYPDLYITGNFNYYVSFFVYLSDILLLMAFLSFGIAIYRREKTDFIGFGYKELFAYMMVFLLLALGSVFITENKEISFFQVFRFIELMLLYILIVNEVLSRKLVLKYFIGGVFLQALIGIGQYVCQGSLGLRVLGESVIGTDIPGVAKMDIGAEKVLRSYGTLSHPNVLAGLIVCGMVFVFYVYKKQMKFLLPLISILTLALLFTFSRSGLLAVAAIFLIYISLVERKIPYKMILLFGSILMFFIVLFDLEYVFWSRFILGGDVQAGLERLNYMAISRDMIMESPWGVGLGDYTLHMQDFTYTKLEPWLYQPVHNIFLLFTNEIGVVGGLFFLFIFGFIFLKLVQALKYLKEKIDDKNYCIALISLLTGLGVIAMFDHYLVTTYQGQIVLILYFALVGSFLNSSALPFRNS
jgi:hypothetical protein